MEITEIVTLDKAARERVKAARQTADSIDSETPAKVQALREEYIQKANQAIEQFESEQAAFADTRTKDAHRQVEVHRKRLDEQYAERGNEWVAHIVSAVTGG